MKLATHSKLTRIFCNFYSKKNIYEYITKYKKIYKNLTYGLYVRACIMIAR